MLERSHQAVYQRGGMGTDLEALMERYVHGEASAFDALYAVIGPKLHAYLMSLSRDRARADDLFQVTFLKIHHARHGWIRGAAVEPWVFAIARNTFYDEARRHGRALDKLGDGEVPEVEAPDLFADIAEQRDLEERAEAARGALDQLHSTHREAFVLTKQMGLSVRDAANVLGATESAVKLRVHRAYLGLRKLVGSSKKERE
jgi:RNA polymerase sigma-70 factor (ECF subfamily)